MIDIHAHVVLEGVLGKAGVHGPELGTGPEGRPFFRVGTYVLDGVRYRGSPFMDVDARLRAMDDEGVDLAVLSPNPLTYFGHIEPTLAADFARWHNDELAAVVAAHPDRLQGFAQLPMQQIGLAVPELRRSVSDLGLLAPYIGTDYPTLVGETRQSIGVDDPSWDEFYSACHNLNVPVFFHPAPPGIDGPLPDPRVRRFDADLWLSFAYEETLTVATLIFGGVLERHPALDVCISHGGGAVPHLAERMAHAGATRPWAPAHLRDTPGAFQEQLRRLWWDCHVGGPAALATLRELVGDDRLVAGTNFAGWDADPDPTHGDPNLAVTLRTNARRLLRLPKA